MSPLLDAVVILVAIVVVGLVLAVLRPLVQRRLGVRQVRSPRDAPETQLHQATSRARTRGAGFGP